MNFCLLPKGPGDLFCCHLHQVYSPDSLAQSNSAVSPKFQGMHIITIFTVMAQEIMIPTTTNETKVYMSRKDAPVQAEVPVSCLWPSDTTGNLLNKLRHQRNQCF